jgi:hypothetical protein
MVGGSDVQRGRGHFDEMPPAAAVTPFYGDVVQVDEAGQLPVQLQEGGHLGCGQRHRVPRFAASTSRGQSVSRHALVLDGRHTDPILPGEHFPDHQGIEQVGKRLEIRERLYSARFA